MTAIEPAPVVRDGCDSVDPKVCAPTSRAALLSNVAGLRQIAAEDADAIEAAGGLTPRLAAAMRSSGVFQMAFPTRRGGLEMGLADQVAVVGSLASIDASTGWHVGVLNATGFYASRLADAAYAQLYPHRDVPTAGSFHPRGRAVQVEGGYMVTGCWDWGSGAAVAEHMIGGCMVVNGRGEPVRGSNGQQLHLGLWLPRDSIRSAANWHTLGLRGSGSASFEITKPAFVPADHSFDREAAYDSDADPLNRTPLIAHYALGGVVLGVSAHLVREAGQALRQRTRMNLTLDTALAQALGEAMGEVDVAAAGVIETARRTDAIIFGGGDLTPAHEARMTAANAISAAALRRIIPLCLELAGSHYVFNDHPIQRVLRDATSALAHSGTRRSHLATLAAAAIDDESFGFTVLDDPRWPQP